MASPKADIAAANRLYLEQLPEAPADLIWVETPNYLYTPDSSPLFSSFVRRVRTGLIRLPGFDYVLANLEELLELGEEHFKRIAEATDAEVIPHSYVNTSNNVYARLIGATLGSIVPVIRPAAFDDEGYADLSVPASMSEKVSDGLTQYQTECQQNGEAVIIDARMDQFAYGHLPPYNDSPKLYYADTEPIFQLPSSLANREGEQNV
jgi:hypothetical protein